MGAVERTIDARHAIVLRMFNERVSLWEVTNDRLDALVEVPSGLEKRHIDTIQEMVSAAIEGTKSWTMTTERYVALQQYLALVMMPSIHAVRDVIQRAQLGGVRDGVAGREWFVEAMKLLLKFEEGAS